MLSSIIVKKINKKEELKILNRERIIEKTEQEIPGTFFLPYDSAWSAYGELLRYLHIDTQ